MLRGRTVVLLWIALPAAWLGGGLLAVLRGLYVHGVWFGAWLLGGAIGAVGLVGVTLWWWLGRGRQVRRR